MISASKKALLASTLQNRSVTPIGIDLDGANDYGSRASDLTGNADGKEFTFSCWFYGDANTGAANNYNLYGGYDSGLGQPQAIQIRVANNDVYVSMYNASSTRILLFSTTSDIISYETQNHILMSIDLANASNRYVYLNDVDITSSVTWTTYSNDNLNFTLPNHLIGANAPSPTDTFQGRLAGLYLDYTYRDLSDSANRRLFIDADGLYVTPPTTGIISMPMDDPTAPYRNDGTGGAFTANGTVARSGRGPNQVNPAASTFDGSADRLSATSITGIADGKAATLVFSIKPSSMAGEVPLWFGETSAVRFFASINAGVLAVTGRNAAGTNILKIDSLGDFVLNKWSTVAITFDLANVANRDVLIDGAAPASVTWTTYTDDSVDFTYASPSFSIGATGTASPSSYFNGELSDFWFDDSYTADLSGFYDTDTGKAKYLGSDGSLPTGSQPLIYLPMRGDDAGNNLGSGGDFTVNSGPYTGARGPNEFWGESAEFNGTTQHLDRTSALTGASQTKTFSFAYSAYYDALGSYVLGVSNGVNLYFGIFLNGPNKVSVIGRNSAATTVLSVAGSTTIATGTWYNVLGCFDMAGSGYLYVNGVLQTLTTTTYTNDTVDFTHATEIAASGFTSGRIDGKLGFLSFWDSFIDFSQEANRLKVFDAFGFPVDMGENGELVTGTAPLIFMNEGFHLGTNLGTGGNFTPNNTPTDGGFVFG